MLKWVEMRKYWTYFKTGLSGAMAYRGASFVWSLTSIISTFSLLMFWLAVYANRSEIAGFSKESLISYYIMLFLLERFIMVYPQEGIAQDIRHGFLSS